MTATVAPLSWSNQGTSFKTDFLCFVLALAFHAPLLWVRMDAKKSDVTGPRERLVAVDLIDELEKKAPPPPVAAQKEDKSFMDKLKALVRNEPPPPPKPQKALEPKKLADAPSQIKLEPKLANVPKVENKLQTKSGFETKNPELVKQKAVSLKNLDPGVATLTAKKVGVEVDRSQVIKDKGNFQIAKGDIPSGIGNGGNSLTGAPAPTVAIRTGNTGSTEKFSAAKTAKTGKSGFSGGAVDSIGDKSMTLRDRIIARDAAPSQIASQGSGYASSGGVGGSPGGLATKRDAGSFSGGQTGGQNFSPGKPAATTKTIAPIAAAPKKQQKKEMFSITGPLKDRPIVKRVIPDYPAWAQAQGIEAAVVLEFTVQPNGRVKNNVIVRRTSGYVKLDQSAIQALKQWIFQQISDVNREEVGLITFTYTLR